MGVEFGERKGLGMRFGKTARDFSRLFRRESQRAPVMLLHHPGDLGEVGLSLSGQVRTRSSNSLTCSLVIALV
jgi:hypothetical protein